MENRMRDNTTRFSERVNNYTKYRPSYPPAIIGYMMNGFALTAESAAADIGSGTGIFTELLISKFARVYAVEPNEAMRIEAERRLGTNSAFVSADGSAEKTTLADASVDFITAAQAFHWFDFQKTKTEFKRILKKEGSVFLIWNKRIPDTDFLAAYEKIISETIPEYKQVSHHNITPEIIHSFLGEGYRISEFATAQSFDFEGVMGRLSSSSYTPLPSSDLYKLIEERLRESFDRFSENGRISFNYLTEVHSGKL